MTLFTPMNFENWHGRVEADSQRFFQIVHHDTQRHSDFALIGYACDEGVRRNLGRVGAALGPDAIRKQLAKLPVQTQMSVLDSGNVCCTDQDMESTQQALAEKVTFALGQQTFPIVLGGGHDLSLGHFMGVQSHAGGRIVGVINFDAHLDMRGKINDQGHSGSSFDQILQHTKSQNRPFHYLCVGMQELSNHRALITHAQSSNAKTIGREDIHSEIACATIKDFINQVDIVYLSVCMDVLAQAYAPGVSAPQPHGLTMVELMRALDPIFKCGKVVSLDVAETNPLFDRDEQTSRCAAFIIARAMHVIKGLNS